MARLVIAVQVFCIGVATTRPPERLSEADLVVERLDDPRVEAFVLGGG